MFCSSDTITPNVVVLKVAALLNLNDNDLTISDNFLSNILQVEIREGFAIVWRGNKARGACTVKPFTLVINTSSKIAVAYIF